MCEVTDIEFHTVQDRDRDESKWMDGNKKNNWVTIEILQTPIDLVSELKYLWQIHTHTHTVIS